MTLVIGCRKDEIPPPPIPEEIKAEAALMKERLLNNPPWRLVGYYTETDYDYDPADTIAAMKDHWRYVSGWLKDDEVFFEPTGDISISQMNIWMPGTEKEIVNGRWEITPDHDGVTFRYMNFTYDPLVYKLTTMNDSIITVQADYNGQTVFSRFKSLQ
jgi:hypothetical protein